LCKCQARGDVEVDKKCSNQCECGPKYTCISGKCGCLNKRASFMDECVSDCDCDADQIATCQLGICLCDPNKKLVEKEGYCTVNCQCKSGLCTSNVCKCDASKQLSPPGASCSQGCDCQSGLACINGKCATCNKGYYGDRCNSACGCQYNYVCSYNQWYGFETCRQYYEVYGA